MAVERVCHQPAGRGVEREGEVARRRRDAAHHDVAAAVEPVAFIVDRGGEGDAVAQPDRQLAVARDRGARVRIDADGAVARISVPGAERQPPERKVLRQCIPSRAEPDAGRDEERQQQSDQQSHV
jgi:hypothetical protein